MHEVIDMLRAKFSNAVLNEMSDAAELKVDKKRLAFSTDSFVVKPLFFPGGDIGKLAVCGTVNDIAMKGAEPLFISLAFIIEEGLEFSILEKIASSIKQTADEARVKIVTGDIKVVEKVVDARPLPGDRFVLLVKSHAVAKVELDQLIVLGV